MQSRSKANFDLPNGDLNCDVGAPGTFEAALTFITTPNAPSGRGYSKSELEALCPRATRGVLLDEAYAEFAEEQALPLALEYPNVLVTRTFSKAYSLCFQRVGYALGHPELITALDKIRDSYNVNGLGQVAALATLSSLPHYQGNFRRSKPPVTRAPAALMELGFHVFPSQTNFLFVRPPRWPAVDWHEALRKRKVLVRWFSAIEVRGYLRITIGTDDEMASLLHACSDILRNPARAGMDTEGAKT
jgi:histidinol-phosphate aminotransferase